MSSEVVIDAGMAIGDMLQGGVQGSFGLTSGLDLAAGLKLMLPDLYGNWVNVGRFVANLKSGSLLDMSAPLFCAGVFDSDSTNYVKLMVGQLWEKVVNGLLVAVDYIQGFFEALKKPALKFYNHMDAVYKEQERNENHWRIEHSRCSWWDAWCLASTKVKQIACWVHKSAAWIARGAAWVVVNGMDAIWKPIRDSIESARGLLDNIPSLISVQTVAWRIEDLLAAVRFGDAASDSSFVLKMKIWTLDIDLDIQKIQFPPTMATI
jgi:hypothetical protein